MSIPLIQKPEKDDINTSIIAIKRNIERINMLLGLSNSEEIDTSEFVKKSDIVDEVAIGNMQSVSSNAVARRFNSEIRILEAKVIPPFSIGGNSWTRQEITLDHTYNLQDTSIGFILSPVAYIDTAWVFPTGHWGAIGTSSYGLTQSNKITVFLSNVYNGSQTCGFYYAIYGKESDIIS